MPKEELYLIWQIVADLSNRQVGGDQVVTIHLHEGNLTNLIGNVNHLSCEYSAGVAEDGHELEVGFGERQPSRCRLEGQVASGLQRHTIATRLTSNLGWLFELWWLNLLKNAAFFFLIAGL